MGFFNFGKNKKEENPAMHKISLEALRGVVAGSPIPQFVIDKYHTIIYWNKALSEYSGMKSGEMIGTNKHWQAFYSYERPCMADLIVDRRLNLIPRLYKGKYSKSKLIDEAYSATDFFPAMGRGGKWLYFTAAPIRNLKGEIIGAVETLEDVTEKKKAEVALKKHSEKLQKSKEALVRAIKELDAEKVKLGKEKAKDEAILMSIGDGLVITAGKEGRVVLANKVFEKMIGWRQDEMMGKSLFEIMPCQDEKGNPIPAEKRFISRVLGGERPQTATFYYGRRDGTRFPGSVTVTEIEFDGEIIGAVSVLRDVTRETEIDRTKTEFISLASHQLRDAPTAISWCTEALLAGNLGELLPKQKEYVEEIYRRNKSAIGLINDLLNVSRIDLGTFIIEPEEISLADVCRNELKQFELGIKEKNLELFENYQQGLPKISADLPLVQVVFQNLISNAVHYTPDKGKIEIKIYLENRGEKEEKEIVFMIADNGCGIPESQQVKIFQRMFRADNAKMIRSGGSGLGLYVVKSILDQVGWRIRFESREGQGTVFYVNIPLAGMAPRPGQTKLTRSAV